MAKKIETELLPEELAALAIHKILNLDYFEGQNKFLALYKNFFNEFSLGNDKLCDVTGYINGTVEAQSIVMGKDETLGTMPRSLNTSTRLFSESEHDTLKYLKKEVSSARSLEDLVTKIISSDMKQFEQALFLFPSKYDDRSNNELKNLLLELCVCKEENMSFVDSLKSKYHQENYRETSISTLSNTIEQVMYNKNFDRSILGELRRTLRDEGLEVLKENYKRIAHEYRDLSDSAIELMKKNKDGTLNALDGIKNETDLYVKLVAANYDFEKGRQQLLEKLDTMLSTPSIEQLYETYKEPLQQIENEITKNYPQLLSRLDSTTLIYENFKTTKDSSFYELMDKIKSFNYADVYKEEEYSYASNVDLSSINGLSLLTAQYTMNNRNLMVVRNEIEPVAIGMSSTTNQVRNGITNTLIVDAIRLGGLYAIDRENIDEVYYNIIEKHIEMARKNNAIFVYDIYHHDRGNHDSKKNKMHDIICELREKNPDVVMVNDGIRFIGEEGTKGELRWKFLNHCLTTLELPLKTINKVNPILEREMNSSFANEIFEHSKYKYGRELEDHIRPFFDKVMESYNSTLIVKKQNKLKM